MLGFPYVMWLPVDVPEGGSGSGSGSGSGNSSTGSSVNVTATATMVLAGGPYAVPITARYWQVVYGGVWVAVAGVAVGDCHLHIFF
jgi:hypothetical protein